MILINFKQSPGRNIKFANRITRRPFQNSYVSRNVNTRCRIRDNFLQINYILCCFMPRKSFAVSIFFLISSFLCFAFAESIAFLFCLERRRKMQRWWTMAKDSIYEYLRRLDRETSSQHRTTSLKIRRVVFYQL